MAQHNTIGALGEQIAAQFLMFKGYAVLDRNVSRATGEIDIIAQRGARIHFIEVKAISHETRVALKESVSRETFRPEEHVDALKLQRLERTISLWLAEEDYEGDWQLDVAAVRMVPHEKYAEVELIECV